MELQTRSPKTEAETPTEPKAKQSGVSAPLFAWFMERFPPANLPACLLLFLTIGLYGAPNHLSFELNQLWWVSLKFTAFVAFFLIMRIIDEHKDFNHDAIHFPERVLHKSTLTLADLRKVAYVSVSIILLAHIRPDWTINIPALSAFIALSGWLFLMSKEFYRGIWLSEHPLIYVISHMLIMPFITLWLVCLLNTDDHTPTEPLHAWYNTLLLSGFAFFGGFAGEIFRKFRAPNELDTYVDAYNHRHSDNFLLIVTTLSLTIMSACAYALLHLYSTQWIEGNETLSSLTQPDTMIIIAVAIFCISPFIYSLRPSRLFRKVVLGCDAMGILLLYLALLTPFFYE